MRPVVKEELDLVMAFMRNEINLEQTAKALHYSECRQGNSSAVRSWMITRIRRANYNNQIKIVLVEGVTL